LATPLMDLGGRIRDAVVTFGVNLLNNMWTEIEYRCICQAAHSQLIEHV
jgi:hypothetical protein